MGAFGGALLQQEGDGEGEVGGEGLAAGVVGNGGRGQAKQDDECVGMEAEAAGEFAVAGEGRDKFGGGVVPLGDEFEEGGPLDAGGEGLREAWGGEEFAEFGVAEKDAEMRGASSSSDSGGTEGALVVVEKAGEFGVEGQRAALIGLLGEKTAHSKDVES